MYRLLATALLFATITACQSTPQPTTPIIARTNDTFETTGLGKDKVSAQHQALNNAKFQCKRHTPIILSDEVIYNGVVDEKMGRVFENGMAVIGSVLGTKTPNLSRDDDYEYHIKFKCD
ncbi:hypothetical protein [Moraxella oblonga]|uniref:hypothetical protein n=1 Tax=Moraxella oblonga TaxID=200413 RepID=UPI00082E7A04|nr:hypothetical protein [Moraxella oblonga]